MNTKNVKKTIALILLGVLIVGGIVMGLLAAVQRYDGGAAASDGYFNIANPATVEGKIAINEILCYVLPIVTYFIAAFYAFIGYREAHGDSIRIIMFTLALAVALISATGLKSLCTYTLPSAAVVIAYISGRLGKLKKNIPLIIFVSLDLIIYCAMEYFYLPQTNVFMTFTFAFGPLLQWATIVLAYLIRFDEHTLAGKAE